MTTIRPARPDELGRLQDIELAAGAAFVDVGMPEVAGDDPIPLATLAAHLEAGGLWVAAEDDEVVAYAVAEVLDGHAHVEQVSVHPDAARRGIGRQLLEHVAAQAWRDGRRAVTLTTFRDVPWNAPYYERCGYRALADDEIGPGLRARMADEAAHGLDPATRVAMVNWLA